jgi:hypothetical protein
MPYTRASSRLGGFQRHCTTLANHPNRKQFTIRVSRDELEALRALATAALNMAGVGRAAQVLRRVYDKLNNAE